MPPSPPADPPIEVTPPLLRERPLPDSGSTAGKHDRGTVLVVGGSRETPGALLLAGLAALRAGAGKLQLATVPSTSAALGVAMPEARVVALAETDGGAIDPRGAARVIELAERCDALLLGPGSLDDGATTALLAQVMPALHDVAVVVDASAVVALHDDSALLDPVAKRAVVTPNPGEMCELLGREVDAVRDDPRGTLRDAIERVGAVVALRDAETWLGGPGTDHFLDRSGHPALGTSGSGDVLVGFLAGLLARGTDPLDATLWAVHVHGVAGAMAAAKLGGNGLLAREVIDTLPLALATICT